MTATGPDAPVAPSTAPSGPVATIADLAALVDRLAVEADVLNARVDALLADAMNAAGQGRLWPPNPPGVHSQ